MSLLWLCVSACVCVCVCVWVCVCVCPYPCVESDTSLLRLCVCVLYRVCCVAGSSQLSANHKPCAMSDSASLRQSPKRPLASETDSEQVDIVGQLRFNGEADDLLTLWHAPLAPPPDPRDILIKETLREIKRAKFADEAPKSVADENGYNEDIVVVRAMSSLRQQRDEALTKS